MVSFQVVMRATSYQVVGNFLAVVWSDGHESYYPLEELRRACPCAACAGEPDLFGRIARGPAPHYSPRSFELRDVERIGNYALQPNWADGHSSGMWTYERLRAVCPCEECRAS
jgi:DUF971 family protein